MENSELRKADENNNECWSKEYMEMIRKGVPIKYMKRVILFLFDKRNE
jgi:hypothetical protein